LSCCDDENPCKGRSPDRIRDQGIEGNDQKGGLLSIREDGVSTTVERQRSHVIGKKGREVYFLEEVSRMYKRGDAPGTGKGGDRFD